ncbi:hypothetical protein D6817_04350 [Candidatus Pacearchaeota archaeon]|nr:MAG: hypothetical protein D6817_04350 [Candidatus Pacearchaeota archaeon]
MSKIVGYLLALLGLAGVALFSIPKLKSKLNLPFNVSDTILMGVSAVLLVVGILLVVRSGSGRARAAEVPIYEGKQVVGFRRLKK